MGSIGFVPDEKNGRRAIEYLPSVGDETYRDSESRQQKPTRVDRAGDGLKKAYAADVA